MIAWCGPREDGLGWLSDRCRSLDEFEIAEVVSIELIDSLCSRHPRRLILSVENRLNYPQDEIRHLQRSWPEIPFALAVGSWFDGSRRTGVGATNHLTLPWYRMWDGWRPWLCGSNVQLLNPWPQMVSSRSRDSMESDQHTGIIVSNCRQTAIGWRAGLRCVSDKSDPKRTQWQTLCEFQSWLDQKDRTEPDWILWDDSCLDTFLGADCLSEVCTLFITIRERFPSVVIIAATCMPRWSDWQQWKTAGANELFAKPSQGVLLRDMLEYD